MMGSYRCPTLRASSGQMSPFLQLMIRLIQKHDSATGLGQILAANFACGIHRVIA